MSSSAVRVAQRAPARKPAAPARKPAAPARKPAVPSRRPAPAKRRQPAPSAAVRRVTVQKSTVVFVVATGAIVIAIMLGLVAVNALLAQASFKIGDLQTRVTALQQSVEERRLEMAALSSPSHVANAATKQGYTYPQGGVQVLTPLGSSRGSGKAVGGGR